MNIFKWFFVCRKRGSHIYERIEEYYQGVFAVGKCKVCGMKGIVN